MRNVIVLGSISLAVAAAVACSTSEDDSEVVDQDGGLDSGSAIPPVDSSAEPTSEGPAGTGLNTGLPCDVQAVIENRCIACHDGKTAFAMLSYNDFIVKSTKDPTKTVAELSVIRMKSTGDDRMPKPPAEPAEADEIAAFENWVKAGTLRETKACTDPPPDGGAQSDAGPRFDGGDGGVKCSSGVFWDGGDNGSELMHPGAACNACHQVKGGPNLRIAGTVYPTLDEVDECNGKGPPPQLTVVVTAADGKVFNVPVNAAGNFQLKRMRPKPPFRAQVVDGKKVRAMQGTVTSGDCNSCHTQTGKNGAPGRILTPQ